MSLVFGVYPRLPDNADPNSPLDDELTLLEQIWLEKTQLFGGKGYNKDSGIRQAWSRLKAAGWLMRLRRHR